MRPVANVPRVAVIGCGDWGRNLARNFHDLGALAGVLDHHDDKAAAVAREFDARVLEHSEMLSDDSISAVVVATQAEIHFGLAREALVAGKHVWVEKPLSQSLDQAKSLCILAEGGKRTLMVGHQLRFHAAFRRLEEMVRNGELGRLQYLCSNRLNRSNARNEKNIWWSLAPHDVSMILALVGERPESVSAIGGSYREQGVVDVVTGLLTFPGGPKGHIFVSWVHPFKEHKLVVVGEGATAVFDDGQQWDRKLHIYPGCVDKPGIDLPEAAATPVPLEPMEPLADACRHFLDCVATGWRPRTDGDESLRVLEVVGAGERSIETGSPTTLQRPAPTPATSRARP